MRVKDLVVEDQYLVKVFSKYAPAGFAISTLTYKGAGYNNFGKIHRFVCDLGSFEFDYGEVKSRVICSTGSKIGF